MTYGIIAAGEGSRLAAEGIALPKPLVPLCGEPLAHRLLRIFAQNNATEVGIVINHHSGNLAEQLNAWARQLHINLKIVTATTPSSMHSFLALSQAMPCDKLCLTTVDTVFNEAHFARFVKAIETSTADALMGVTTFVDDEKPLWIEADESLRITGFHNQRTTGSQFVSGGIYGLSRRAIDCLADCANAGVSRMRGYQQQLVANGLNVHAFVFGKILDVDHAADIDAAEAFLKS